MDDAQAMALLEKVAARDEHAFRLLYEQSSRRVYAYAMHRLRDPRLAAEIVAEVLYDIWRRPAAYRGEARYAAWLLGVARNKMTQRWPESLRSAPDEDAPGIAESSGDDDALDGYDALAQRQRSEGFAPCLKRLGEPHRECLYLAFCEGLSQAEIGALQQVPSATVKTRLFHARAKIKRCVHAMLVRERAHA